MKLIFSLSILCMVFSVNGQKVKGKFEGIGIGTAVWNPPIAAQINNHSDTIEIMFPLQVHYIKIGATVYQIIEHEPTVEKTQPFGGIIIGTSPMNKYYQNLPWNDPNIVVKPN